MITVHCRCGEAFHADAQHAGRRLRCRCGKLVEIVAPPPNPSPAVAASSAARRRWPPRWRPSHPIRSTFTNVLGTAATARYARRLTFAAFAYLGVALVAVGLLWGLSDSWWPATVFLFLGRWVLLLPLALLLPAALLLQPRMLIPLLTALVLILFPVMGLRTGIRVPVGGMENAPRLRVVSFNTASKDIIGARLGQLLAEWQPDVVALQECSSPLAATIRSLPGWQSWSDRGLCILSRYPITATAVMDREALQRISETSAIGGSGDVVLVSLMTTHGRVDVVNLHLETPRKGFDALARGDVSALKANTTLRAIESRLARRWVGDSRVPTIVTGDFNMPVESRIYQKSWGDLANAFSEAGRGFGMTRYNGWIRVRIDHVLASGAWSAERAIVGEDQGSDHRPVIVDLRLRDVESPSGR